MSMNVRWLFATLSLLVSTALAAAPPNSTAVTGFVIEGNHLLSSQALQQALLPLHGRVATEETLQAARQRVIDAYSRAGFEMVSIGPIVAVTEDGIYRLPVTEIVLTDVRVQGNSYFTEAQIRRLLPALRNGETPNLNQVARQLLLAGDNPSLDLSLDFHIDAQQQPVADILVEDSKPVTVSLLLDNSGDSQTSRSRLSLIASHANLWGRGHNMTLSITGAPENLDNLLQLGLAYYLPLPERGDSVLFTASHSTVNVGRVANAFDIAGSGNTYSLHYSRNLQRTVDQFQQLDFGIDYRLFRDSVSFSGVDTAADVTSRPISVTYRYSVARASYSLNAGVSAVRNWNGGKRNDDSTYAASRFKATADWDALRAAASYQYWLPNDWTLDMSMAGQYSDEPLIGGEQFGIGGIRSVRGLEERELIGDSGLRAGIELQTPALAHDQHLLVFADAGRSWRHEVTVGEKRTDTVAAAGIGWRWSWQDKLSARVDLATVLAAGPISKTGHKRANFEVGWVF